MSKSETERYGRTARIEGTAGAASVRETPCPDETDQPGPSLEKKLAAIRAAAQFHFPAPDIDQMLEEVLVGLGQGLPD
jgi:hypothetical protein